MNTNVYMTYMREREAASKRADRMEIIYDCMEILGGALIVVCAMVLAASIELFF